MKSAHKVDLFSTYFAILIRRYQVSREVKGQEAVRRQGHQAV